MHHEQNRTYSSERKQEFLSNLLCQISLMQRKLQYNYVNDIDLEVENSLRLMNFISLYISQEKYAKRSISSKKFNYLNIRVLQLLKASCRLV